MRIDVQELAKVLQFAPHRYLGIARAGAAGQSPLCSMITDRSMTSFHFALTGAQSMWPKEKLHQIVGGDELIHAARPGKQRSGRNPPGFEEIQDAEQLMQFDGSDTAGDDTVTPASLPD